ncbi:MAG TPA: amylo-alpha-1,6-glucosidase [Acetivibrio saccincola]|uniref:amylo-alpha-1,6-glucosidase n=1 Tax=Acetivibrio saccincola TaxID=1677857 RepID=UPI002CD8F753|nr:amylo-alpha-1,6-glucosidase [Acetivibrio saccincola]HOA96589.1 amylo-alpha-1,6-glucosidase [Acetivibrio saccincola]HQD27925.1 amylo-alpha-1,6-glucosidase [Acetivibrio saccincola]
MNFGKSNWRTYEQGIQKEWLLTNGIGGFASSTIIGANTRRYHGLLIAALKPPVNRHLVLSKIDESVIIDGDSYNLFSYETPGFTMKGYHHLERFKYDLLPEYIFRVRDVYISKKISMVYGENTVAVVYYVKNGTDAIKLRLTPLVNFKDHHFNSKRQYMSFTKKYNSNILTVRPSYYDIDINVFCSHGTFTGLEDCWFYNMDYAIERERGLESTEDHYIPGYFDIDIKPEEEKVITIISTVEKKIKNKDGLDIIKKEEKRQKKLISSSGYKDEFAKKLVLAADKFIVYRESTDAKTIIAGYPWFTDWGRDTMIALTGLTLSTKRFDDAKEILYTFSKYVKDGLIPNMFPDGGHEPLYNTVDAALWYFEAVNKYVEYTGDYEFIKKHIYQGLKDIINSYANGTHFNIKMDKDFLITAGDANTQLTWMDAKVGDWVVTPRHGKAVEINALWYNALKVMANLSDKFGEDDSYYNDLASKVKKSFVKSFWNEEKQCLYDCLTNDYKDGKVRPNQIMAVSLSNAVLDGEKAKKTVNRVFKELYTAYGLRSLSPESKEYAGIYAGDQWRRDGSYHQGTVWTWPLGQFITAYVKVNGNSDEAKEMALRFIEPFKDHLEDACLGSISEIFDGDEPLVPRGCFAQAWSVSEILRAYIEDVLK